MDPDEVKERVGKGISQPDRVSLGQHQVKEVDENPQVPEDNVPLARAVASAFQNLASTTALQVFNKFIKVAFEGGPDPFVADDWLDEVEKHLRAIDIPDDRLKTTLATYKFVKDTAVWWKTMTSAHNIDSMSWDSFKNFFFDKYFPQTKRRELRTQFDGLEQGDMSVTEYENKFTSLSRFTTDVSGNEEEKTWRFVYGLNRSIRPGVTLLGLKNYSEAVTKALMAETEAKD
ncbi:uncharacterized protein LOC132277772 [Cornus florida]|uniref:uncharacterized protein LOC132277772 n=1 Tax=Cornus florida TaxID=4283 RepID=UPI0028990364|nr:uncharacterized protein LOC132277772 [Cornus florida]